MTATNAAGTPRGRMPAYVPDPDHAARTRLTEVELPLPAAHEALIAVEAFSVNRGETFLLESPRPGWRPGQDVAGRIVAAAVDGSGPAAGTRVVAHAWQGGWAPLVACATDAVAALPDEVETTVAATLPLAGLTGLRLLQQAGDLVGKRLLITGASGGVGHVVTELAVGAGADVVAVSSSAERGARLQRLGASVISNLDALKGSVDVAFESVGGPLFAETVIRLKPGGLLLWFGQASREPVTLDFFTCLAAVPNCRIGVFSYWDAGRGPQSEDLATLVRLVATNRLDPEIGFRGDWAQTPDALLAVRDRRVRGNAVLTIPLGLVP